jgi:23S rRNA pseudouridine1911/1915/1917 synthase
MQFNVNDDPASGAGERIDRYLAERLPELSRGRLQALIKDGHITLNGRQTKPRQSLAVGDEIAVELPEETSPAPVAQAIPLTILHEDEALIVIDKPHGIVVHPAAGNPDGTLVNAFLHHCPEIASAGDPERPGIVHRLDKDTSGCLVGAKTPEAHTALVSAFSERRVRKLYLTAVDGCPPHDAGRVENQIARSPHDRQKMAVVPPPAGKLAITEYRVRSRVDATALVECDLHTGRTHQIRVHMKSLGCPVLGDPIYAKPARQSRRVPRLMLHAWKLAFTHPISGQDVAFEATPPEVFSPWLDECPPQ